MIKIIIILCILKYAMCTIYADYFWRDYYGVIPKDAVPGGTYYNSETFIGQTYDVHLNGLFPGTIYINDRNVYYGFKDNKKSTKFNKILCSGNLNDLKWIKTNITALHMMTECNQIIAGFYENAIITLGRANYQGITYIGKVYDYSPKKWHYLSFRDINNNLIELKEFEVLTYGCTKRAFDSL